MVGARDGEEARRQETGGRYVNREEVLLRKRVPAQVRGDEKEVGGRNFLLGKGRLSAVGRVRHDTPRCR